MINRILLSLLIFTAVNTTACGPETGSLEIYIVKSTNPAEDPLDPGLISHLKIRVTGDNMTPIEDTFAFDVGGSSTLEEIPAGKNRVVTVEGLAGVEGFAISRGRSVPFKITSGRQQIELFMARIGRFSRTPGFGLNEARFGHSVTVDSQGLLWIIGGSGAGTTESPQQFLNSYEIYDPTSGALTAFDCAEDPDLCLIQARSDAASALADDSIYVAGGRNDTGPLDTTEEISREDFRSESTAPLEVAFFGAESVVSLPETLIAGGRDAEQNPVAFALLFDSEGLAHRLEMPLARYGLAGARSLEQIFLFGGFASDGSVSSDYQLFSSSERRFSEHSSAVAARAFASAVSFTDGRVLILGGESADGTPSDAVDLFDPRVGALCPVGQLNIPRSRAAAAALPDGRTLLMGGLTGMLAPSATAHVEIVDARFIELFEDCTISGGTLQSDPTDRLQVARYAARGQVMSNGTIAIVGGLGQSEQPVAQIEVYIPE